MHVQPYLFLDGRCEEAIEFYKTALGAKVEMLMRFKESPDKTMCAPGSEDKVMHASFKVGDTTIMSSDGRNTGNPNFQGFALSITGKDEGGVGDEGVDLLDARGETDEIEMHPAQEPGRVGLGIEGEVERLFNALADVGKVTMPLTKTFFSPRFGMLADKFGVNWMVLVAS